jgi:hypothetical protein
MIFGYSSLHPLNAELNPICHLLALLGDATTVDVSRLRVNCMRKLSKYSTLQDSKFLRTFYLLSLTCVEGYNNCSLSELLTKQFHAVFDFNLRRRISVRYARVIDLLSSLFR